MRAAESAYLGLPGALQQLARLEDAVELEAAILVDGRKDAKAEVPLQRSLVGRRRGGSIDPHAGGIGRHGMRRGSGGYVGHCGRRRVVAIYGEGVARVVVRDSGARLRGHGRAALSRSLSMFEACRLRRWCQGCCGRHERRAEQQGAELASGPGDAQRGAGSGLWRSAAAAQGRVVATLSRCSLLVRGLDEK